MTTKDLKARLSAAMTCLKAVGSTPTGVIMHVDGSFTVLTGDNSIPSIDPANDENWLTGIGDGQKTISAARGKAGNA
ncbi:MAG: hypothetical protein ACRCT6_02760 [Notoacmeibacter sp.]